MTTTLVRGACTRAAACTLVLLTTALGARAQEAAPQIDWELISPTPGITRLYTPSSGAFLARTETDFIRSDDGGLTWRGVVHPSDIRVMTVDPTDHDTLYAGGVEKDVYKTTDGGAVWARLLKTPERLTQVWVSAADHNLIFLSLAGPNNLRLVRSTDGGATWIELETHSGESCSMPFFEPHPTRKAVAFRTFGCNLGRRGSNLLTTSQRSLDSGSSWEPVPVSSFAELLAGGRGTDPERLYVAANGASTGVMRGAWLARSDDGGKTWATVLSLDQAEPYDPQAPPFDAPIRGLTFDPTRPDHIFIGVAGAEGGARVSVDGGMSWSALGSPLPSAIRDLGLGIDGRYLFAATEQGLWRFDVTPTVIQDYLWKPGGGTD